MSTALRARGVFQDQRQPEVTVNRIQFKLPIGRGLVSRAGSSSAGSSSTAPPTSPQTAQRPQCPESDAHPECGTGPPPICCRLISLRAALRCSRRRICWPRSTARTHLGKARCACDEARGVGQETKAARIPADRILRPHAERGSDLALIDRVVRWRAKQQRIRVSGAAPSRSTTRSQPLYNALPGSIGITRKTQPSPQRRLPFAPAVYFALDDNFPAMCLPGCGLPR